ncbi:MULTISPECIES: hypothetical protein [Streptomyces]|uniref:hypothetical protein n=1 Tax=Streptomyces TaxID=1883 RepID=UPI00168267D1|nr:hypothetical protein [Streptomyces venezuelae]
MADDDTDFAPGDGPSSGISVSLTDGTHGPADPEAVAAKRAKLAGGTSPGAGVAV